MTWIARREPPVPDDVARLLATVPEWFGRPEANAEYIAAAEVKETWTVRDTRGADGIAADGTAVPASPEPSAPGRNPAGPADCRRVPVPSCP